MFLPIGDPVTKPSHECGGRKPPTLNAQCVSGSTLAATMYEGGPTEPRPEDGERHSGLLQPMDLICPGNDSVAVVRPLPQRIEPSWRESSNRNPPSVWP
jgi:hypothetical protein